MSHPMLLNRCVVELLLHSLCQLLTDTALTRAQVAVAPPPTLCERDDDDIVAAAHTLAVPPADLSPPMAPLHASPSVPLNPLGPQPFGIHGSYPAFLERAIPQPRERT